MRRLVVAILFGTSVCAAQTAPPQPAAQDQVSSKKTSARSTIVVPAGTAVSLAITNPVWNKTAKVGDSVYAETAFPVAVNNQMAIPPGTYVQGEIDTVTRPGLFSPHAQFQIHFTKAIFANGYTVVLGGAQNAPAGQTPAQQVPAAPAAPRAPASDVIPAVASVYVDVSFASDILLDNGTQIE